MRRIQEADRLQYWRQQKGRVAMTINLFEIVHSHRLSQNGVTPYPQGSHMLPERYRDGRRWWGGAPCPFIYFNFIYTHTHSAYTTRTTCTTRFLCFPCPLPTYTNQPEHPIHRSPWLGMVPPGVVPSQWAARTGEAALQLSFPPDC
jgi:hypothetical protein